jgi:ribosomal protein S18 acetylase RimI-like enzyme
MPALPGLAGCTIWAGAMAELTVRIAGPKDAPALARLLEAFNGPPVTPEQARARLRAVQGLETVFLAERAGEAIGFASLRLVPYLSDDVPRAELTELYVEATHRHQGVGRALMAQVEALARKHGATELVLLTGLKNQEAQAFYRALGYADAALAMDKRLAAENERPSPLPEGGESPGERSMSEPPAARGSPRRSARRRRRAPAASRPPAAGQRATSGYRRGSPPPGYERPPLSSGPAPRPGRRTAEGGSTRAPHTPASPSPTRGTSPGAVGASAVGA